MFDVSQENDTAASRTREALSRQMLKKGRKMGNYCGHFSLIPTASFLVSERNHLEF